MEPGGEEKKSRIQRKAEAMAMAEDTVIEVTPGTIDGGLIFHVVYDILAFLLFMHQQIPSMLQDMTLEFDSLQNEYKELDIALTQNELNASSRRKHIGRKRGIKLEIRKVEKLMSTICSLRTAFQLMVFEVPNIEDIIFVFGASPRRPRHVYEISFPHGSMSPFDSEDMARSRTMEVLSRKVIRALISKGIGSSSYSGPCKLFLLVKAPASLNMPLHFLPKRDFQYANKIIPFRLLLRPRTSHPEMNASGSISETTTGLYLKNNASSDLMWFQCRHVIKGLALGNTSPEE